MKYYYYYYNFRPLDIFGHDICQSYKLNVLLVWGYVKFIWLMKLNKNLLNCVFIKTGLTARWQSLKETIGLYSEFYSMSRCSFASMITE